MLVEAGHVGLLHLSLRLAGGDRGCRRHATMWSLLELLKRLGADTLVEELMLSPECATNGTSSDP